MTTPADVTHSCPWCARTDLIPRGLGGGYLNAPRWTRYRCRGCWAEFDVEDITGRWRRNDRWVSTW